MAISTEGAIGIGLTLLFGAGAGAMSAWPDQVWIGKTVMALSGAGIVALGFYYFREGLMSLWGSRRTVILIALMGGVLWFDYWYFSNYSTNGGIWHWHIQIGLQPPPSPAPPKPPAPAPPTPAAPWVSQDEIDGQQKLGHTLIKFSPEEILGWWVGGQNIGIYMSRWIKVDYPAATTPTPETLEKKDYYVIQMNIRSGSYFSRGSFSAYFDPKKWGDRLIYFRQGERLKAYCQFQGIERTVLSKDYGGSYADKMTGLNCELP